MRAERLLIRLAAPLMFGGAWRGDGCNAGQCSHNSHCCGGWCGDCDNCIDCAAGHYCPSTWAASDERSKCFASDLSSGHSSSPCAAGTFSTAGSISCTPCPIGTYSAAEATSCTSCAAGKYAEAGGSAACTLCPENTFSGPGAAFCQGCPRGQGSAQGSATCFHEAGMDDARCAAFASCNECYAQSSSDGSRCKWCRK